MSSVVLGDGHGGRNMYIVICVLIKLILFMTHCCINVAYIFVTVCNNYCKMYFNITVFVKYGPSFMNTHNTCNKY